MSIKRPGNDAFDRGNKANDRITVPCGKCAGCLSNQRSDWTFRLKQELKGSHSAYFVTLTYDENKVPQKWVEEDGVPFPYNTLRKSDLQLFIKRLRTYSDREAEKYQIDRNGSKIQCKAPPLRYYAIGEYGPETLRPHYHGLFFNMSEDSMRNLDKLWKQGFIKIGDVNTASIHYVTKYVINRKQDVPGVEPAFSIMSRRPGIGSGYINNVNVCYHRQSQGQKFQVTNEGGIEQRMPRFYKQKIFTKNELQGYKEQIENEMDSNFDAMLEELYTHGSDLGKVIKEQSEQKSKRVKSKILQNQKL